MSPLRFRRPIASVHVAAALLAASLLAHPAAASDASGQIEFGGQTRTFAVHVPDRPAPQGGFPLVLIFHGGGQQGATMKRLTGLDALADSRGFIAVYPDGIDKHWNDGRSTIKNPQNDVGFVGALLDHLEAHARVDRKRIYATGISNGALFAERLGCDLSQRIAAIAPVAGTLPADIAGRCHPSRRVAVMQIDGTTDPIMPFKGGKVADFGGRGEGGDVLSVAATSQFWARHNGCTAPEPAQPMRPAVLLDPTRIVRFGAAGCPAGGNVSVLSVVGGGHTWPGGAQYAPAMLVGRTSRQIDASRTIVDFFLSLPG